jgi:F420-non-reducing hydrogenase iron-sulfur subunit
MNVIMTTQEQLMDKEGLVQENSVIEVAQVNPEAAREWEPKIIAFLCNWCSYAGADLAGVSRFQYPPNVRVIRVPCSGRISPYLILHCLQHGADGVIVSGCHPGDCHYLSGNYIARRKFTLLNNLLEYIGIEKGRVQFAWVSASEGNRFAELITQVTNTVKELGPARQLVKISE